MNHDQIVFHLEHSSTVKLLRSDYASLALSFFYATFKKQGRTQIPLDELKVMLNSYLEEFTDQNKDFNLNYELHKKNDNEIKENTSKEKNKYHHSAEHFINLWSNENHRFIRKYYDYESDTPIVELTYDTERAIEWMENLEKKEFVGTHSRFSMIFDNLQIIASEADQTPQMRLNYLEEKEKGITNEIKEIQRTGSIKRMDQTLLRERFLNLIEDSRKLIADFCLVEEIFKDLTQKIKEQKLKESVNKGDLLGQILDAYDGLEESDQGKSFTAFWNFLMSSTRQSELNDLIKKTILSSDIRQFVDQTNNQHYLQHLKKFKSNLLQVGQKVLKQKFRLSEELRKLLQQKCLQENKQVMEEIFAIKKYLIENKEEFLGRPLKDFMTLDYLVEIQLPMERPLWSMKNSQLYNIDTTLLQMAHKAEGSDEAIKQIQDLKNQSYIDKTQLRERIQMALESSNSGQVTLKEIVDIFPISKGLAEVVAYLDLGIENENLNFNLSLNSHSKNLESETNCSISSSIFDSIFISSQWGNGLVRTPQIIFYETNLKKN